MGKKNEKISQDYNSSCFAMIIIIAIVCCCIMQSGKKTITMEQFEEKKRKWIQNKLDIQNDITKKKKLPMQNLP